MPIKTQKNVKTIPKAQPVKVKATDLQRIKNLITEPIPKQTTEKRGFEYIKNEELEAKKQHLLEVRKEKEDRLFQRFAEEEKKREILEREDDIVMAKERKEAVDKASTQMFMERDQVKAFVSKMKHVEVLEGLKIQQELKEYRQMLEKNIEEDYAKLEAEKLARFDEMAWHKENEAKRLKLEQKVILEKQREDIKKREEELKEQMRVEEEHEKLVIMTALYEEQFKKLRQDRMKKQNGTELIEANNKLLDIKRQEQLKEEEEDMKIASYNAKQESKLNERKKLEDDKFEKKQVLRMKMIEDRALELEKKDKLKQHQLDSKIEKHKQTVDEKFKNDAERKRQEQEKNYQIIKQQLEAKKKQIEDLKEAESQIEKDMIHYMEKKHLETEEKENLKKDKINNKLGGMVKYNKDHHANRLMAEEKERLDRIAYGKSLLDKIKREDAEYNTFAEKCISEWKDNGRNVMPIVLELQRRKNEFMK